MTRHEIILYVNCEVPWTFLLKKKLLDTTIVHIKVSWSYDCMNHDMGSTIQWQREVVLFIIGVPKNYQLKRIHLIFFYFYRREKSSFAALAWKTFHQDIPDKIIKTICPIFDKEEMRKRQKSVQSRGQFDKGLKPIPCLSYKGRWCFRGLVCHCSVLTSIPLWYGILSG